MTTLLRILPGRRLLIGPEGILNTQNANIKIRDKKIQDKLLKIKTNKAAGPDEIFPRALKE